MAASTGSELAAISDGLKKIQLLAGLSDDHLSQLALHTSTDYFDVGTRIVRKDEFGDRFYMLKEGQVRCANIGRREKKSKVQTVDLTKGAHFGERALIRDELRACDVVALTPTVCYTVGREDFVNLLGNLSEAMERSLAVAIVKSLPEVAADPVALGCVSHNNAAFDQLTRKEYKTGDVVCENASKLTKLLVVRKGVIELRRKRRASARASFILGIETRNLVTSGRVLGIHALGAHPRCADAEAVAIEDVVLYEFDPEVIAEERKRIARHTKEQDSLPRFEDLDVQRTLGMGTFGRVKLCTHTDSETGKTTVYRRPSGDLEP